MNGLYWGVYDAVERPDASFAAAYQGGAKEEYDVVNEGQLVDGTMAAYQQMLALGGLQTPAGYEQMKGSLDVPAYIDYLLLHFYTGHEDWFTDKNWYASRRRVPGAGFRYQSWDGELMLNSPTQNIVTRTDQPSGLHVKLLANAQYRLDFADRVQRHCFRRRRPDPRGRRGPLPTLGRGAGAGDGRRVRPLGRLPPRRAPVLERSLRTLYGGRPFPGRAPATALPVFSRPHRHAAGPVEGRRSVSGRCRSSNPLPAGGRVPPGTPLTLAAPSGTVFHTLDGTDPRTPHTGAVAPGARPGSGPVTLAGSVRVKARTRVGDEWSALVETSFEVGGTAHPLVFTEVHYHPADGDPYEFVELRNVGSVPVDVSGWFLEGVEWIFPPGSEVAPGRILVLASDLSPGSFSRGTRVSPSTDGSRERFPMPANDWRSGTRRAESRSRSTTMIGAVGRRKRMAAGLPWNWSTRRRIPTRPHPGDRAPSETGVRWIPAVGPDPVRPVERGAGRRFRGRHGLGGAAPFGIG